MCWAISSSLRRGATAAAVSRAAARRIFSSSRAVCSCTRRSSASFMRIRSSLSRRFSRTTRQWATARSAAAGKVWTQSRFCTKSNTPACMLASTDSSLSSPDSMMTGTVASTWRMRLNRPRPSRSGMLRSETTTSGVKAVSFSRAWAADSAVSTSQPWSCMKSETTSTVTSESSTTSRRPGEAALAGASRGEATTGDGRGLALPLASIQGFRLGCKVTGRGAGGWAGVSCFPSADAAQLRRKPGGNWCDDAFSRPARGR